MELHAQIRQLYLRLNDIPFDEMSGHDADLLIATSKHPAVQEALAEEPKNCTMTSVIARANRYDKNGRRYLLEDLQRMSSNLQEQAFARTALGAINPESDQLALEDVATRVTTSWMDGNMWMVTVTTLDTPKGRDAVELIKRGEKAGCAPYLGMTTRGVIQEEQFEGEIGTLVISPDIISINLFTQPTNEETHSLYGKEFTP
jgi:hypothetical protein